MTKKHNSKIDLSGQKIFRLTVIKEVNKPEHLKSKNKRYWLCKCDCGIEKIVESSNLRNGHSKSCGCLKNEMMGNRFRTHGRRHTAEYRSWYAMKDRCLNDKCHAYKDYGGRGIKISQEWIESFEKFYSDMGKKPSKLHSIDRIDNEKGYTKSNCKWSTPKEQANNRRLSSKNKTGIAGVHWDKSKNSYRSQINYKGKMMQLYNGVDFFNACCFRKSAENKVRGNI